MPLFEAELILKPEKSDDFLIKKSHEWCGDVSDIKENTGKNRKFNVKKEVLPKKCDEIRRIDGIRASLY
jgi:hypothetical protein